MRSLSDDSHISLNSDIGLPSLNPDVSDLVEHTKIRGSVFMGDLSSEEQSKIKAWFFDNFDQLGTQDQIDYLEELAINSLISDQEALLYAKQLSPKQQCRLGQYIGKNIKPGLFPRTLHECWYEIDHDDRTAIARRFGYDEQEHLIMVAPFVDVSTIKTNPDTQEHKSHYNNLVEEKLRAVEDARPIFEAVLDYCEDHSDKVDLSNIDMIDLPFSNYYQRMRAKQVMQSRKVRHLNPGMVLIRLVEKYMQTNRALLMPYLSRLERLGMINDDAIKKVLDYENIPYQITSQRDSDHRKSLAAEYQKFHPKADPDSLFYDIWIRVSPRHIGIKLAAIQDNSSIEICRHMLGDFDFIKQHCRGYIDFLVAMTEESYPVLLDIEKLGLTKEEVALIINRAYAADGYPPFLLRSLADLKSVLDFNQLPSEENGNVDLEKIATKVICKHLSQGGYDSYVNQGLIVNFTEVSTWFSSANRDQILKTINQCVPELWLKNLNYMTENSEISTRHVVDSIQQPYVLLSDYFKLKAHIHRLEKRGVNPDISSSELKSRARGILISNAEYILSDRYRSLVEDLLSAKEAEDIIENRLDKRPTGSLISSVLFNQHYCERFKAKCRNLILKDKDLFIDIADEHTGLACLSKVLEIPAIIDRLIIHIDSIDPGESLHTDEVINYLASNPEAFNRLIGRLKISGLQHLGGILNIVIRRINSDDHNHKYQNSSIKQLKNKISSERKKLQNAGAKPQEVENMVLDYRRQIASLEINPDIKTLPFKLRSALEEIKEMLTNTIISECERSPGFVFHKDILDTLESSVARPFIERDIEDYAVLYPQIILKLISKNEKNEYIDPALLEKVIRMHYRSHLFELRSIIEDWPGELSGSIVQMVETENPFRGMTDNDEMSMDYYDHVIKNVSGSIFYPLFKDRLAKIAQSEQRRFGERFRRLQYEASDDFNDLINQLCLLNLCPLAVDYYQDIIDLPDLERQELLNLLELISRYHIDETEYWQRAMRDHINFKDRAGAAVTYYIADLFELSNTKNLSSMPLSGKALRAFSIYHKVLKNNHTPSMRTLQKIVTKIFDGEYENWRNWGVSEPNANFDQSLRNLKDLDLVPQRTTTDQHHKWTEVDEADFETVFEMSILDVQFGISNTLQQAIDNQHIEAEYLLVSDDDCKREYSKLIRPLNDLTQRQQALKQKSLDAKKAKQAGLPYDELTELEKTEYKELQAGVIEYRNEHEDEVNQALARRFMTRLSKISSLELEGNYLLIDKTKHPLKKVFHLLNETIGQIYPEFSRDISRFQALLSDARQNIFNDQRVAKQSLQITDRIDPENYILIGEKPVQSCQHYDGSRMALGLLSYISDPNVKIIQLVDEDKQLIARCVMRLLSDEDNNPALFLEQVYSVNSHHSINEAMIYFARQKATKMGVELYVGTNNSSARTNQVSGKSTLYSNGSRAGFVYTDAGGGKRRNGVYSIDAIRLAA